MSAQVRPILALLSGNLLGTAVGAAFFLAASRRFGLEEMGRYAVAISAQWVVFGLIGAGMATATLRFAGDRIAAEDRPGAAGVVAGSALAVSAAALLLALVFYGTLTGLGLHTELSPALVALTVLWAGARALIDCLRSGLLAQENFTRAAAFTGLTAATGLASLLVALTRGDLSVERLLVAHVAGLGAGALAGMSVLRALTRDGVRIERSTMLAVFDYGRWPALSEGTRLLQANLGPPLLARLAGAAEAGLFSLGRYPAYVFEVVAVTLYQYWLARAVRVQDRGSMRVYLWRQLKLSGALGGAVIVAALATQPLLPLLGENFARAGPLFVANAADFAILLLIRPIETVYHGLRVPRLELVQRSVTVGVLFVAALPLASRWGALGMAGAHVLASAASLGLGVLIVRRALATAQA